MVYLYNKTLFSQKSTDIRNNTHEPCKQMKEARHKDYLLYDNIYIIGKS